VTRQLILEQQGYEVSSAFGFAEAMEICAARHDFNFRIFCAVLARKESRFPRTNLYRRVGICAFMLFKNIVESANCMFPIH
jgi:hypothetical protein